MGWIWGGSSEINGVTNASLSGDKYAAPIKKKYFRKGEGRRGSSSRRIVVLMVSLCFGGSRESQGSEFSFFWDGSRRERDKRKLLDGEILQQTALRGQRRSSGGTATS